MVFDLWCMYRWDHWVMDVLTCNLGGIIIGHMIMRYYSMKQYRWMNVSGVPPGSTCSRVCAARVAMIHVSYVCQTDLRLHACISVCVCMHIRVCLCDVREVHRCKSDVRSFS